MKTNHRIRWILLAVVASLIVIGWVALRQPTTELAAGDAPAPASAPSAGGAPAASAALHAPTAPNLEVPAPTVAPAPVKLPPPLQKALDDNPHLAAYYRLQQKVLPSGEDRDALHAMLSDSSLIEQVVKDLLAPELMYTKDVEAKRMVGVEFLGDAVAWGDNPAMGKVMEAVEGVIFADNISAQAPDDLSQSLAGDKAELYTQLLHRSPERAAAVASHAQGTQVEALLTYSKRQYDSSITAMKADEAQPH